MDNIVIKKISTSLEEEYRDDNDFKFSKEFSKSGFIEYEIDGFLKDYEEYESPRLIEVFLNLSFYGYERFIYTFFKNRKSLSQNNELIQSVNYAYLTILLGARCCKCFQGNIEISMTRISFLLGINIIANNWQESSEIGDYLIDSLNAKNCIIRRGDAKALKSWFVLELYSIVSKNEFNKRRALYPKDFSIYGAILKEWDTKDFKTLDNFVTTLSDKHLELAITEMSVHNEDERKEELELPAFQIFPYEILTWLKLREKAGLKNPTEYTHPLMNTPIAKMFLNIKEPLEKPTALPYAKELLEKLKEKCPDVEIPQWLGGEKEKELVQIEIPTIHLKSKDIAPKTGRYQATLAKGHEKEEMLTSSGFDIKTVKEGETVGTFGLSGSDESDIVWVYLGE